MVVAIQYEELMKKQRIYPGDKITLYRHSEKGRCIGTVQTKVVSVHRHHVLLDFGKYKESRRIADLALGLADI